MAAVSLKRETPQPQVPIWRLTAGNVGCSRIKNQRRGVETETERMARIAQELCKRERGDLRGLLTLPCGVIWTQKMRQIFPHRIGAGLRRQVNVWARKV